MPLLASALDAEAHEVHHGERTMRLTPYFGRPMDDTIPGPQSHLIEPQWEDFAPAAHYHVQDQYQIFLNSIGTFGSQPLKPPVTLQYADAFTPYGPFSASEGTLHFVTMRNAPDPGPRWISDPEARAARRNKGGGQFMLEIALPVAATNAVEVLSDRGDGVSVHRVTLDAGRAVEGPSPAGSLAHYYLVLGGTLAYEGRAHPRLTHLRVDGAEPAPLLQAGEDGVHLLVLGFRKAA